MSQSYSWIIMVSPKSGVDAEIVVKATTTQSQVPEGIHLLNGLGELKYSGRIVSGSRDEVLGWLDLIGPKLSCDVPEMKTQELGDQIRKLFESRESFKLFCRCDVQDDSQQSSPDTYTLKLVSDFGGIQSRTSTNRGISVVKGQTPTGQRQGTAGGPSPARSNHETGAPGTAAPGTGSWQTSGAYAPIVVESSQTARESRGLGETWEDKLKDFERRLKSVEGDQRSRADGMKAIQQVKQELEAANQRLEVRIAELESQVRELAALGPETVAGLEQFQSEARALLTSFREKKQRELNLAECHQALADSLRCGERVLDRVEQFSALGDQVEAFCQEAETVSTVDFFRRHIELTGQLKKLQEQTQAFTVPWNSILTSLFREAPEIVLKTGMRPLDPLPEDLVAFVQTRGFQTFWPSAGDDFDPHKHRVIDQQSDDRVPRSKVIRAVTPGLKHQGEVPVKAGIFLSK